MLKCIIPLEPELFLLNIIPSIFSKAHRHVIIRINTAARLVYAQMWKNIEITTVDVLVWKIYEIVERDMLTERMRNSDIDRIKNI